MTELSPQTQALLELGRAGDDPNDAAIARNRHQLSLKVGGAAIGAAVITSSAGKALAASSLLKALAVSGAVVVAGGALYSYASPGPRVASSAQRTTPPPPPALERIAPREAPSRPAHDAAASAPPAPPAEPPPRSAPAAKSSAPTSIQGELELIRGAQKQLHRGNASGALALLAEHAQRFPSGALAQERDASRVLALCQAGEVASARAQAERFLQRSPQSPFAERVRASCAKVGR